MSEKNKKKMKADASKAIGGALGAFVQIGLAVIAYRDLARRDASQVKGPKLLWGFVIPVNIVGPLSYLLFAIRR